MSLQDEPIAKCDRLKKYRRKDMSEGKSFVIVEDKDIQNMIYTLREKQIMLDRDLATLYGVKSIRLREQVKEMLKDF